MKKKIVHIISSKIWRGGEQQVHYLFNNKSKAFEIYLFCPEDAELVKQNLQMKGKIFTYKKRFGFDILAAIELKKVCKKNQIDLIHLHDSHAINTYLLADLIGMNIPAVIHRHVNFSIKNKWKYQHKNVRKIICVSETVKHHLISFINEKKLVVINPSIDIYKFQNSELGFQNLLKQELNLPNETKIIGIVTALEKEKNVDEFIKIAIKLHQKNKDYHFVIIGDGSLKTEISNLIPETITTHIHILGFRNNAHQLLPYFDIFLFTSKNEGFPLVLLESMASKVPVVTNNFPSSREIIQHEKTGFIYTDVENAVEISEKLLTTIDSRLTTIENAFSYVQQFDISLMNRKIEEVYNSVFPNK